MPSKLSNLCSSSVIPRVVTTSAWVSPLVKRAEPCVLGKTPTSHLICLTSAKLLPSILFLSFKIAGTKNGITSLQMDIKITGITFEIMEKALDQAKSGREHILVEMNKAIKTSRKEFSKHTPKMETIKVDKKDIATVIGKGGATIREVVETSGAVSYTHLTLPTIYSV